MAFLQGSELNTVKGIVKIWSSEDEFQLKPIGIAMFTIPSVEGYHQLIVPAIRFL